METINKISEQQIEIVVTKEFRRNVSKAALLAQKERIEKLLLEFEK